MRNKVKLNRNQNQKNPSISSDKDQGGIDKEHKFSIVMVGCGSVGKSSITLRFVYDEFEEIYDPTQADSYRKRFHDFEGKAVEIDILDTAGQEEYAAIRDNYYRSGEGFILVYSITDKASFTALPDFRSQIIRSLNDPTPPILLIGNKSDLNAERCVSKEEGEALAEKWKCKWLECSAKRNQNIDKTFMEIQGIVHLKRKEKEEQQLRLNDQVKRKKKKFKFKCIIQ